MTRVTATYRVQLNKGFTLDDLIQTVPYLHDIGISHLYLSPVFESLPGSNHGYDVIDPTKISVERGGEEKLYELDNVLSKFSPPMKMILDIVPNHLAANPLNPYWNDVLKNGQDSPYWKMFDLRVGPEEKIRLPVLQDDLDHLIECEELKMIRPEGKPSYLRLCGIDYPISPDTPDGLAQPLKAVLDRQNYVFVDAGRGAETICYRRFFDVTGLIGVRVEDPEVFALTHQKIFELLDGMKNIEGVRVDHIDGLADPAHYLKLLSARVKNIWVEKILAAEESLPEDWPVLGATGYEFIDHLNRLFIMQDGYEKIRRFWSSNIDSTWRSFTDCVEKSKAQIIDELFPAEFKNLGDEAHLFWRALAIMLPVYRTYFHCDGERDPVFRTIREWQQLTGAVMAKGLEDTAHYRYIPLSSLNDVGCAPENGKLEAADFIAWLSGRAERHPWTMNASTTHDTKRSEDARLRIHALSGMPERWIAFVTRALDMNPDPAVPPKTAYMLYQAIIATWPLDNRIDEHYRRRIQEFMKKATREAKQETCWIAPDENFEALIEEFTKNILSNRLFLDSVQDFSQELAPQAAILSLSALTLKIFSAGVPDFYQGSEVWCLNLVDPDNRRSVDFQYRRKILSKINSLEKEGRASLLMGLCRTWEDGAIKLWLTRLLLNIRSELFLPEQAIFKVISVENGRSAQIISYQIMHRSDTSSGLIITTPVNLPDFMMEGRLGYGENYWHGTTCRLSGPLVLHDLISDTAMGQCNALALSDIFRNFPVSILRYAAL